MKTLLREPLLYFLLLGGTFFLLYQQFSDSGSGSAASTQEIRISEGRIQALGASFEKTWQRPPSAQELDGLVNEFVREEIYYREALALGLDRDDPLLRRRLRQKLEFMLEDVVTPAEADDAELQAYLDANAETYRQAPVFSFQQVYLDPGRHGENLETDAMALLEALRNAATDADSAGDSIMLPQRFDDEAGYNVERSFGGQFLQQLVELPVGSWQGPIVSGFGLHLVHVSARVDGRLAPLEQVRERVLRDWTSQQRQQTNEAIYQNLRKRYEVTIEAPLSGNGDQAAWVRGKA